MGRAYGRRQISLNIDDYNEKVTGTLLSPNKVMMIYKGLSREEKLITKHFVDDWVLKAVCRHLTELGFKRVEVLGHQILISII